MKKLVSVWLIFGASLVLALALYFGFLGSPLVDWIASWTALGSSYTLNLLGLSTAVQGTILSSDRFAVSVVAECTAVGPLLLFMGAVGAYPSPLRAKGLGIILGIVILTAVNLVRITSLFLIGSSYPQHLATVHLLIWQPAIIILAIVLWLFWVQRIAYDRNYSTS